MAGADWFITAAGREQGPFSAQQLKQFVAEGKLKPDMMVRKDGAGDPVPAGEVKGLFSTGPASGLTQAVPKPPSGVIQAVAQAGPAPVVVTKPATVHVAKQSGTVPVAPVSDAPKPVVAAVMQVPSAPGAKPATVQVAKVATKIDSPAVAPGEPAPTRPMVAVASASAPSVASVQSEALTVRATAPAAEVSEPAPVATSPRRSSRRAAAVRGKTTEKTVKTGGSSRRAKALQQTQGEENDDQVEESSEPVEKSNAVACLLAAMPFVNLLALDAFYMGKMGRAFARIGVGIGPLILLLLIVVITKEWFLLLLTPHVFFLGFLAGWVWAMVDFCQYADHSGLKSRAVATILAGFAGPLGLDCFYLGKTGKGFGRIAANLGFGLGGIIWSLIDLYAYADGRGTDSHGRKLV